MTVAFPKPIHQTKAAKRLRPRNVARAAKAIEEDFGPLADAVRLLPCCVKDCNRRPTDPDHVVTRGAGGHAWIIVDGAVVGNIAPVCHAHHTGGLDIRRPRHAVGLATFEAEHTFVLRLPFERIELPTLAAVAKRVGEWFLSEGTPEGAPA